MAVRDLRFGRDGLSEEEAENPSFGDLKIYWRFGPHNLADAARRHDPSMSALSRKIAGDW
jgi:hypothetical protein